MLEIADRLRERGSSVMFSSSDEVAEYIVRRGYGCNRLPLADVRYSEGGAMSLRATVVGSPQILARTYRQLYLELGNLKRFGPQVVLSDSSIATTFAARTLRIRVYTIINQLSVSAPSKSPGVATTLLSEGTSVGMAKLWELSDEVLLPDLPPPYTISESNLWNGNVRNKRYIGFLINADSGRGDSLSRAFSSDPRPKVFWQVSGPPKTRGPFIRIAEAIAFALGERYAFVLTEGDPRGRRVPVRFRGGWRYGWCDSAQPYFDGCEVVVSRAGHGTIARAITSSKPSLLVPIPNQTEQEGNAGKAADLGVALRLGQHELTPERFRRAVEALRREPFISRAKRLGGVARSYDASKAIIALVESKST